MSEPAFSEAAEGQPSAAEEDLQNDQATDAERSPTAVEELLQRESAALQTGRGASAPLNPGSALASRTRRQTGTPIEGASDGTVEKIDNIGDTIRPLPYPVRLLMSRHCLSSTTAAFIARELRMRGD